MRDTAWLWLSVVGRRSPSRPRVDVALGASVPAWGIRIAGALVAIGCTASVTTNPGYWLIAGMLVTTLVFRPSATTAGLFAAGLGALLLTTGAAPYHPRVFLLVFALHLLLEMVVPIVGLPAIARVEVRVLAGVARAVLAVQVPTQALVLAGAWLSERDLTVGWVPVLAGLAVAGLGWALLVRLQQSR